MPPVTSQYVSTRLELGAGVLQVAIGAESIPGTDIGGTLGAELSYKQEVKDIEIDQAMAPVVGYMIGEEGMFKITVLEQQLRTIALAMGLTPSTDIYSQPTYQRIKFGGKKSPLYCYLTYTVEQAADTSKAWIVELFRARIVDGLVLPFQKKEERKFDLNFKLYADSTQGNALGYVKKEV